MQNIIPMKIIFWILVITVLISSCSRQGLDKDAQHIVDLSIKAHGGDLFQKAVISFDFRERHYSISKSPRRFEYIREFTDTTGFVRDLLTNEGFERTVNGFPVELPEDKIRAFSNSVNSVAYFAFLPYGLNDPAVVKSYLGETEMEEKLYHLVKVTFRQEGGGEDFDDEFLYWFHKENHMIDYMAYSYHTDGGGVRFRKAIRKQQVGGLVLLDYENYKPTDKNTPIDQMEALYKEGKLELLSEILLENIKVTF